MRCLGAGFGRFHVVAGPDACVDRPELVAELRAEASRAGISTVAVERSGGTRFAFEIGAESPQSACSFVTSLFQAVYGLNWWADVTALCGELTPQARAAGLN